MGKGLKEGLFEVYKDSSIIQLIGQLLEHKYCQLYVKHITDPKANVENPKAATEGGAEETCHGTTSGSLGRKGVDAVVDPAAEENLSEEDDPELQDIRSQVQIAKKNKAEKLKNVRLEKDLETIREARQDKQKKKGKEKKGAISTGDAAYEGHIIDYPSFNEAYSINSGESSSEFGDDEDTLREKQLRYYFKKSSTFPQYEPTCIVMLLRILKMVMRSRLGALNKGLDPNDCVHNFYKKDMFLEAYGKVIEPVRDPKFWERTNMHEPPILPKSKKKKDRPKKLRRKTVLETTIGKDRVEQISRKGCLWILRLSSYSATNANPTKYNGMFDNDMHGTT
ncbi:hypothetical protein CRG98_029220 [Punica granatum]|uniref:Uncharacterized protein n=1 Tax=Punica granatum TaxID=22663 RepID=A0A2I0J2D6_PUNGR|nr:hypothetical protein CRG98_029220 [Punica granatum]